MRFTDLPEPLPAGLRTDEFVLRPIRADDAAMDYAAVMETREFLRLWQQSTWPEDDFTVEANRTDLVDLERRHGERYAFTYTVLDPGGTECLGCVYVFNTEAKFLARSTVTPVGGNTWEDVQAVVYFWVRQSRMTTGMDERLLDALRVWFREAWGFGKVVYVASDAFRQQVDLFARTDMTVKFEIVEPDTSGRFLAFG